VTEKRNVPRELLDQMGGISGLIYSSLPVVVFVPVSTLYGLKAAIIAALSVATLILVWRIWRRDTVQPAVSGFIGVGISVAIAYVVGESKGYFLLGIWSSLLYAAVFAGSVLIPLGDVPRRYAELDPEEEIVVHCKMGGRSAKAADFLRSVGFKRVRNLTGGILDWIDKVDPSQPKY